ncbi:MAG: glycosyltransferase [Micromonosporaceae bacterium]|nr:glycosyltransferase [Micromonosporaceae bacterium]
MIAVGVVIATRDRPTLVRRAVAAARAQDYPGPVRVVVVHDRSEPDRALATGGERPVSVVANQRTSGLAGARNTGILALDTELVAFCDDDDVWAPGKLREQVAALAAAPAAELVTCAIEVEYGGRGTPRLAGRDRIGLAELTRSRMAMLHASTFLARRAALVDPARIGLVAEDAPGSQNEDWDLLLRAARRTPVAHVDAPLVRVLWGRSSFYTYEYATKIASLRWMLDRHPELAACRPGAARVYGQLACWSAASGDRRAAWHWAARAVRHNWRELRTPIAVAAVLGALRIETVLAALHRRGRGL